MADDVVSAWDAAPFDVIVAEAGGVLTDWTGAPTAFGGDLIVTNHALDSVVREILVDAVVRAEHPSLP
jgi:fructose-1,6-bisphosphatase/inositol monophosphatase family enzyme